VESGVKDFYGFLFQGDAYEGTHVQWPRMAIEQRRWTHRRTRWQSVHKQSVIEGDPGNGKGLGGNYFSKRGN
jgi:hypothetical protein